MVRPSYPHRAAVLAALAVAMSLSAVAPSPLHAADQKPVAKPTADPGKPTADAKEAGKARVFEMRTYTPATGKLDALHARFRDHTNRLLEKHGATLVGHWVTMPAKDHPDAKPKLVWILAYPSLEAREKTWKAFGEDPDWVKAKNESEKDGKLVEKAESVFMTPADYSPMR